MISVSGGKDSTALLLWALENLPQSELKAVFADTGNEHDATLKYINYLERETGVPIKRVRAKKLFYDLCLEKQIFPSPRVRFCTTELKMVPVREYLKTLPELTTVLIGIRRDESISRRCTPDWEWNEFYQTDVWRPIADWTVEQVFDIHKKYGIEPNPLYKKGFARVGCFPCIHERKRDIEMIARKFPEHIEKIRQWEKGFPKERTFFSLGPIDKVVEWSGALQGELFVQPSCQSMYGLCE